MEQLCVQEPQQMGSQLSSDYLHTKAPTWYGPNCVTGQHVCLFNYSESKLQSDRDSLIALKS
jgi:hypothetical protein